MSKTAVTLPVNVGALIPTASLFLKTCISNLPVVKFGKVTFKSTLPAPLDDSHNTQPMLDCFNFNKLLPKMLVLDSPPLDINSSCAIVLPNETANFGFDSFIKTMHTPYSANVLSNVGYSEENRCSVDNISSQVPKCNSIDGIREGGSLTQEIEPLVWFN